MHDLYMPLKLYNIAVYMVLMLLFLVKMTYIIMHVHKIGIPLILFSLHLILPYAFSMFDESIYPLSDIDGTQFIATKNAEVKNCSIHFMKIFSL